MKWREDINIHSIDVKKFLFFEALCGGGIMSDPHTGMPPQLPLFRSDAVEHYSRAGDRDLLARHTAPRWSWVAILGCLTILTVAAIAAVASRADVTRNRRGHTVAHDLRTVVCGTAGRVASTDIQSGDFVAAGAKVAVIESDDVTALRTEASELREVIASAAVIAGEPAHRLRDHEQARLASIESRLATMPLRQTIIAPAEGRLIGLAIRPGDRVAAGQELARIETAAEPHIAVFVPARDARCLRPGTPAEITIDCCPQRRADVLRGVVTSVASRPNRDSLYLVRVGAPDLRNLVDGTPADVTFAIATQQRVAALAFKPLRRWLR